MRLKDRCKQLIHMLNQDLTLHPPAQNQALHDGLILWGHGGEGDEVVDRLVSDPQLHHRSGFICLGGSGTSKILVGKGNSSGLGRAEAHPKSELAGRAQLELSPYELISTEHRESAAILAVAIAA